MESRIIVVRVTGEDDTTGTFKSFTNRVVGRGLLIPDNNEVFFGYRESHGGAIKILVSVGTVRPALTPSPGPGTSNRCRTPDPACQIVTEQSNNTSRDTSVDHCCEELQKVNINSTGPSPEGDENFLHDNCHVIEYLFTDPYYRRSGYGKEVLSAMQAYCMTQSAASPFRLWAASKARSFFRRNGYALLADTPSESRHSVMIFQHLYPMEKSESSQNRAVSTSAQSKKRYRNRRHHRPKPQTRPTYGPG